MISITKQAAAQIRKAAEQSDAVNMFLRIAARREEDGSIGYGMGFDKRSDKDAYLTSEGIDILISNASKELLMGAVLDYVEINPGEFRFIFKNPNDPAHITTPPDAGNR